MAYTHSKPNRFNDENLGALYGAESLLTAIEETVRHPRSIRALTDANAPPQVLERLILHVDIQSDNILDIRLIESSVYDPENHDLGRRFASYVVERSHQGISYHSVRRRDGECVVVYDPTTLSNCRVSRQDFCYDGNGNIQFPIDPTLN
jgi:RES domain-containing protein